MTIEQIRLNVDEVYHQIKMAAQKVGKSPEDITLVGVTKYADLEETRNLVQAGVNNIGENRVQEAVPKMDQMVDLPVSWHFVGHLQSNKVKYVIDYVTLYHSLDRHSLAKELNKRGEEKGIKVPALVQVNVAKEERKHGVPPENMMSFVAEVLSRYEYIDLQGLMTMTPYDPNVENTRGYYGQMYDLFCQLEQKYGSDVCQYLSMGMSHDYHVAIEEGANMVRVGRALFKSRGEV